jgi:hypothetical protein
MARAEKQPNDESPHHDACGEEQPAELPTGPGVDDDGAVWKRVPPPHDDYIVSDRGDVVSLKRETPHKMRPKTNRYGYAALTLCHEGRPSWRYIARIVWQAHEGPIPDGFEVHHRNGLKLDNRLENLECVSGALHRRKHTAKLSEEEAAHVRWMTGHTAIGHQKIADHFGVSQATVWGIAERRSWQDIEPRRPDRSTIERIRNAA